MGKAPIFWHSVKMLIQWNLTSQEFWGVINTAEWIVNGLLKPLCKNAENFSVFSGMHQSKWRGSLGRRWCWSMSRCLWGVSFLRLGWFRGRFYLPYSFFSDSWHWHIGPDGYPLWSIEDWIGVLRIMDITANRVGKIIPSLVITDTNG